MERKRFYLDSYGFAILPPDWRHNMDDWYDRQDELTDQAAESLQEFLDFDLRGFFSEGRGGDCFVGKDDTGNSVEIYPNFEADEDDSWVEPEYKTFPLILRLISDELDYLRALKKRFVAAPELKLVLLRTETSTAPADKPSEILFALPPTTPEEDDALAVEPASNDNETA